MVVMVLPFGCRQVCPGVWVRGHEDGGDNDIHSFDCVTSPFSAIQTTNTAGSTTYTQGCDLFDPSTDGFAAALAAAKASDTVVLGLGIEERRLSSSKAADGAGKRANPSLNSTSFNQLCYTLENKKNASSAVVAACLADAGMTDGCRCVP